MALEEPKPARPESPAFRHGKDMNGHYVNLDLPWYETRILNCSFCGKMVAVRFWRDDAFPADKFCEPACADVKRRLSSELANSNHEKPRKRKT